LCISYTYPGGMHRPGVLDVTDYWHAVVLALLVSLAAIAVLELVMYVEMPSRVDLRYVVEVSNVSVTYIRGAGKIAAYTVSLYYPLKPGNYRLSVSRTPLYGPARGEYMLVIVGDNISYTCRLPCTTSLRVEEPFIMLRIYVIPLRNVASHEAFQLVVDLRRR